MSTALVTGATAGIGRAYATLLARQGYDVVLVARDHDRLDALAAELTAQHGHRAEVLAADLTDLVALARVEARLSDPERPVDVLVNNAGIGVLAAFHRSTADDEQRMLDLNVRAVMRLTHAALPGMLSRRQGRVVNVASVAAWTPTGSYAATKAYVQTLSQALDARFSGRGVRVQALCPGFVRTELHDRMGMDVSRIPEVAWLDAEAVVADSWRAVSGNGPSVVVPDLRYKAASAMVRHLPLRAWDQVARRVRF